MADLLIIIDPQVDFHPGGSLAIPTAGGDAGRIKTLLSDPCCPFSNLIVTLDSHHKYDIAHPQSWVEAATSDAPSPFTLISNADLQAGKFKPKRSEDLAWALEYTAALEAAGRFQLCIWPEHCLVGCPGHNVDATVQTGITAWLANKGEGEVDWVLKGQNRKTEMYSALKADVEIPGDAGTQLNSALLGRILATEGKIYVCGQARSHCVNFTVRDLVDNLQGEKSASDIVLLRDCMSDVPGFEESGELFFKEMRELGVQIKDSTEL
jgi:nicotinamidase-related amidase